MSVKGDRKRARGRCRDKRLYRTEEAAQDGALLYAERHVIHYPIEPYRCPVCDSWHIGHSWKVAIDRFREYLASERE